MTPRDYHAAWKAYADRKPLSFFLHIVKGAATANKNWKRCKDKTTNSELCALIKEFEGYVANGQDAPQAKQKLFIETAYVFWLLGDKEPQFADILQNRISQSFVGTTYYEAGHPGFRQFEYELHTMCRLVEEGFGFEDIEGNKEPDLLVKSDTGDFLLEVKMPTSNMSGAIKKALGQILGKRSEGAIVVGLDHILGDDSGGETSLEDLCGEAYEQVKDKAIVCYLEFSEHSSEGAPGCILAGPSAPAHIREVIEKALTGD